jgi:hypothetical protein
VKVQIWFKNSVIRGDYNEKKLHTKVTKITKAEERSQKASLYFLRDLRQLCAVVFRLFPYAVVLRTTTADAGETRFRPVSLEA